MPSIATHRVSRILERMELQSVVRHPDAASPREEALLVTRDQVREPMSLPEVPVQPELAAHRVDHSSAAVGELFPFEHESRRILWRGRQGTRLRGRVTHWQATTPSDVAGAGGVIRPEKYAQVSGYDIGWVAIAAQPPAVADTICSCVPFVVL